MWLHRRHRAYARRRSRPRPRPGLPPSRVRRRVRAGVAATVPDDALAGHPERRTPPARGAGPEDGHGRAEGADLRAPVGRNPESAVLLEELHLPLGQCLEDRGGTGSGGQFRSDPPLEGWTEPAGEGIVRREEVEDHLRVAGEPGRDSGVQVC